MSMCVRWMTECCIGGSYLVGGLGWLRSGRCLHGRGIGSGRTAYKSQPLRKQGTKAEAEHDFLNGDVTPHEAVLVVACVLEVQLVDVGKLTRAHRASRPYGFRVCGIYPERHALRCSCRRISHMAIGVVTPISDGCQSRRCFLATPQNGKRRISLGTNPK